MARPKADLDSLAVPKGSEAATADQAPQEIGQKGYSHTLSLRMTSEQYRRLRRHVAGEEERTGRRITHQALIEAAVERYLTDQGS